MSGRLITIALVALTACEHGRGGGVPLDGGGDGDGGGSGIQCGGFAGTQCPADEFCDFPTNNCGGTDETGFCARRPMSCDTSLAPVCGCDGTIHPNPCTANAEGFDLNANGTCTADPGEFLCGFLVCSIASQYCERQVSDVANVADDFACVFQPAGCGNVADCACLAGEACGSFCSGNAASGLQLDCPGG